MSEAHSAAWMTRPSRRKMTIHSVDVVRLSNVMSLPQNEENGEKLVQSMAGSQSAKASPRGSAEQRRSHAQAIDRQA